ncbi:MAG: ribosome assembly factor SBDS [Candidatus Marsarchaeota archaeon]|jgi:ribosome maturation protein SDO1|nr:ribosome assembly factor SBDS [Candidatus Marsarchaeota archaeon]MCL5111592.1 ribosome assembly factor SBDS [Candidatus Marsarchaeota archaeon]
MASSKTVIAKYERNGSEFEIFVDSELAHDYITGKITDPLRVLEAEEIFKDARKGERQNSEKIKKVFGTDDLAKVVDTILKKGNVPITTEQRNRLVEDKRKQIIALIAKNSIDPRTNAPNPPMRIENAMREAKVAIDPFKSANEQIDEIVKRLSVVMPLKFTTAKISVTIPAEYANGCFGVLKQYGLKSEQWLQDGSLQAILEFPAGMQSEFFDRINKATQGRAETKLLES